VGKTTCTTLAANGLSQYPYGYHVTVVDADQQKSISTARWFDAEDQEPTTGIVSTGPTIEAPLYDFPYHIENIDVPTFEKKIPELDQANDIVLIDAAGKLDTGLPFQFQEISRVIAQLDYLIIPFIPGKLSLGSSIEYLKFALALKRAREAESRKPLHVVGFINMDRPRTQNSRHLIKEIDVIKDRAGIEFMKARLKDYTLYKDVDTLESFYNEDASDPARLNYTVWIKELEKILMNGKA
jgi:cellulose biosynthesis protein BcsQ